MAKNVYIASTQRRSGKSLVLLGVMELLSAQTRRLGIFRPIVRDAEHADNDLELARRRYAPELDYRLTYAATYAEGQMLLSEGRIDELLQRILAAYKRLEQHCDFIVCEGTDYSGVSNAFEFEFNVTIAQHLGSPLLVLINGRDGLPEQLLGAARGAREVLLQDGCSIAATIVNRVAAEHMDSVKTRVATSWSYEDPIYVIEERESLSRLTIGQIQEALSAQLVHGDQRVLDQEVSGCKVAAMQLPNVLRHLEAGSLVITPGDRADVVLGSMATVFSENYPPIAGIILTGGLKLDPEVQRLLDGIHAPGVPILAVENDTYTTANRLGGLHGIIHPANEPRIATALGAFAATVDRDELLSRLDAPRSERISPMMFEYQLVERARQTPVHIVLPEGTDERILRAADILRRRDVVRLTLLGVQAEIQERLAALGLQLDDVPAIDPERSEWHDVFARRYHELRRHRGVTEERARDVMRDVSYFGTMMVYEGLADGMVSGAAHTTAHTIRPSLEFIRCKPGCTVVSSVFLMCLPDRVLVYGDCAINPNPTPRQLADIALSSAETARMFGIEPRVAMLSYSTGQSGAGEDVDRVREATQLARSAAPNLLLDGPMQYDAAIDAGVAAKKLPNSHVAGRATVFVFPDLNTGNNTYKAVQRSAGAVAIGPVLQGLNKPVNDLSRGCTVTDIVNTVAITAIQAAQSRVT